MTVDVERRRGDLLALRARLVSAAAAVEHGSTPDGETGELPSWGPDELADHASDTYDRELDGSLEENAGQILREIDVALERLDHGMYGTCAVCGKEIPAERLEAVPYATLCVEDKRRLERG